jgi:hypothetical protein
MRISSPSRLVTVALACAAFLTVFSASTAHAQTAVRTEAQITPRNEFYANPEIGLEFGGISRGSVTGTTGKPGGVGFANGIVSLALGARFGMLNLGIRYQGSYAGQTQLQDLQFHKLYGEVGMNWRSDRWVANAFFDLGYSALVSHVSFMNGLGGKLGLGIDFYFSKWFSVGPVASFDVQGFDSATNQGWINTIGASFIGRVGFHI